MTSSEGAFTPTLCFFVPIQWESLLQRTFLVFGLFGFTQLKFNNSFPVCGVGDCGDSK